MVFYSAPTLEAAFLLNYLYPNPDIFRNDLVKSLDRNGKSIELVVSGKGGKVYSQEDFKQSDN